MTHSSALVNFVGLPSDPRVALTDEQLKSMWGDRFAAVWREVVQRQTEKVTQLNQVQMGPDTAQDTTLRLLRRDVDDSQLQDQ